jgi:hypothetical protein
MANLHRMRQNFRADYEYTVDEDAAIIAIVDLDLGNKSVTNDMENVLDDIKLKLGTLSGFSVIYKDSLGRWDGVRLDEKGTVHFYGLGESEPEKAAKRLLHPCP